MKLLTTTILAAMLPAAALASIQPRQSGFNLTFPCSDGWPPEITDTTYSRSTVLYFHIGGAIFEDHTPLFMNQNIQLRTLPNGAQKVVVNDDCSPVLLARLHEGILHSSGFDDSGNVIDLGPTGVLADSALVGTTRERMFEFSNSTAKTGVPPPTYGNVTFSPTVDSRNGWVLESFDGRGTYSLLSRDVNGDEGTGFIVCPVDGYFEVKFYQEVEPGDFGNCTQISVQTVVVPSLVDGECTL